MLHAQLAQDTTSFYKALELESAGKYKEAAPLFRTALNTSSAVSALLGLERVYAELGWSDSLLAPLDTLIRRSPRETVYRSVQLRTLQSLGREVGYIALDRWVKDVPGDPSPRIVNTRDCSCSGGSGVGGQRHSSGDRRLADERSPLDAQLRAAMGLWKNRRRRGGWPCDVAVSRASGDLRPGANAGRNADAVRQVLLGTPIDVTSRRALAGLEMGWGSPTDGWTALKDLPPDSASASAWTDFATRAEGEERWGLARDALVAALRWRRTPDVTLRAATAAVHAGDPSTALKLLPLDGPGSLVTDSARAARTTVPLQARALAMLGRPAAAERLVERFDRFHAGDAPC
jgi:hypothetical protein